jgi:hypothetical protein
MENRRNRSQKLPHEDLKSSRENQHGNQQSVSAGRDQNLQRNEVGSKTQKSGYGSEDRFNKSNPRDGNI